MTPEEHQKSYRAGYERGLRDYPILETMKNPETWHYWPFLELVHSTENRTAVLQQYEDETLGFYPNFTVHTLKFASGPAMAGKDEMIKQLVSDGWVPVCQRKDYNDDGNFAGTS